MIKAGPEKSRALMNENPRYIFFSKHDIPDGQGPKGAMQVPLTAMGSIAIDPSQNPYGIPVWLETRLPTKARDYRGVETGLLVITQDTGHLVRSAIRKLRAKTDMRDTLNSQERIRIEILLSTNL